MNDFSAGEAGTIVLVHGLWVNPRSWEGWKQHYEARGYRVLTPAWPGLDREVEELRRDPAGIAGVGLREVVDHYQDIIRALDRPPIIMGHSFGTAGSSSTTICSSGRCWTSSATDRLPRCRRRSAPWQR